MNDRVELEMKIMRFWRVAGRTIDEEALKHIKIKIERLERKLREIDE